MNLLLTEPELAYTPMAALHPILTRISVPTWNRLEAEPRGHDMTRSLQAEVRDALWMLTRQWQMGEFAGDDAGTPIYCNLKYSCAPLLYGQTKPGEMKPLEPIIECRPIINDNDKNTVRLDIRLQMGNYWLKLLSTTPESDLLRQKFIDDPKFALADKSESEDAAVLQQLAFYKKRGLDGYKLYLSYEDNGIDFSKYNVNKNKLVDFFDKFKRWFETTYLQPADKDNIWNNSRLEYAFKSNAILKDSSNTRQQNKKLVSEEYYHGHLDWYNFDIDTIASEPANELLKQVSEREYPQIKNGNRQLIPGPVQFDGMPEPRFWSFEDGATNFAAVKADHTDLGKLALIEFGLIYSNDWSIVPLRVPVGSFTDIQEFKVIDSFGKETIISPMNGPQAAWQEWSYFSLHNPKLNSADKADSSLFIPPSIIKPQQSKALEEVNFIRDEMANLVWAIETIVPFPLGDGISGREPASKKIERKKNTVLEYEEQTYVPANWIPFAPVAAGVNKIVLRRGKVVDENGKPIRPLTGILRSGLDSNGALIKDPASNKLKHFDIEENEVTREGIIVTKTFQRCRGANGEVFVWTGMQKKPGKGEGNSGLKFDQI